jgi:hypothetical protein
MRLYEIEHQYPKILEDESEIAKYISSLASDYVDEEFIEEYFRGTYAVLKTVPIDNIKEGDKDHNIQSKSKEKKYMKMDPTTMPPLIVENNIIMDGHHRYRVAKNLGFETIKIYDVIEKFT